MTITTLIINYEGQIVEPQDDYVMWLVADEWELVPYKYGLPEEGKKQPPPDLIVSYRNDLIDLKDIKQKWGYIPFLLYVTGERQNIVAGMADWTISYVPNSGNNYYFPIFIGNPLFIVLMYENQKNQEQHKDANKNANKNEGPHLKKLPSLSKHLSEYLPEYYQILKGFRNTDKSRFCNFIYSHHYRKFSGTIKRAKFCRELMKYKKVDCAGKIMQNTNELKRLEENNLLNKSRSINPPTKLTYMSKYKFTIAFENQSYPHYITEKILDPFLAGSIPIYWGCPQVAQMFNPAAFINCHDYSSLDEVVSRVQEIDNDDELYLKYATAPPFLPDSLMYNFTPDKVQAEINQIMQEVVKHKELYHNSRSYSWLQKATEPQLLRHYIQMNRKRFHLEIKLWALKIESWELKMRGIARHILIALRVPERLWRR